MSPGLPKRLIALDTDRTALRVIETVAGAWYQVNAVTDFHRAAQLLKAQGDTAVFICDEAAGRLAGKQWLLEDIHSAFPHILRIVLTRYEDLPAIVNGLHSGLIQRLVQKPIVPAELAAAIQPAGPMAASAIAGSSKAA